MDQYPSKSIKNGLKSNENGHNQSKIDQLYQNLIDLDHSMDFDIFDGFGSFNLHLNQKWIKIHRFFSKLDKFCWISTSSLNWNPIFVFKI